MAEDWRQRSERNYEAIKAYYLSRNGKNWPAVSADPRIFNRVWRHMLGLPKGDMPPPEEYRNR